MQHLFHKYLCCSFETSNLINQRYDNERHSNPQRKLNMKYLTLYNKFMEDGGKMDAWGLCQSLKHRRSELDIFMPTGNYEDDSWYWGYNGDIHKSVSSDDQFWFELHYRFTPLRQNIVLFLACINNEL